MCQFERHERAHRFRHHHTQRDRDGELEITVEGKQDQEDEHDSERSDHGELAFGGQKLAVLSAPFEPVAKGQSDPFSHGLLPVGHRTRQIATQDAVLDPNVARVVLSIDKRGPVALPDMGELAQRNLLAGRSADQQIGDFVGARPEPGLHADHKVKELFSLDHLGGCLAAYRRLDHAFHVRDVDPVAGYLFAVDVHEQAWLAELAHHGQLGEPGDPLQNVLDLEGLVLQDVQVRTVYLHRQCALEPGERLVHSVFGGLGEVENDAGVRLELLADGVDQLVLGVWPGLPGLVLIRLESDVELAVEKAGGVGAVVRTTELRAYDRNLWVRHQDLPDLGSDLARSLE